MKIVVDSFKPPARDDEVKEIQANGFFVGGEKYIALRSDESRLYGKKVRLPQATPFLQAKLMQHVRIGQRRHRNCQDKKGPSHCTLPRDRPARRRDQHCGNLGRLPQRTGLLDDPLQDP